MDLETVAGRIVLEDGRLRCESRRTLGSAFMMFGMVFNGVGLLVILAIAPVGQKLMALVGGAVFFSAVWYWAGGRFGTFVIDPERRELRTAEGEVLAPLDQVRFFTVFDGTDGRTWSGRRRWLTASCPGFTRTYRLGKMSADEAERVLAQLRAWGCRTS